MSGVAHLVTVVDLAMSEELDRDTRQAQVTVRHEAVLTDGRRVMLLDDRGWGWQINVGRFGDTSSPLAERRRAERQYSEAWEHQTIESLQETARMVVGPDEPFDSYADADVERFHWEALVSTLHEHGVTATVGELAALRHDVVLSDRVMARVTTHQ